MFNMDPKSKTVHSEKTPSKFTNGALLLSVIYGDGKCLNDRDENGVMQHEP